MADRFWIVLKPRAESVLEDILFDADWAGMRRQFLGGLEPDEIHGHYDRLDAALEIALMVWALYLPIFMIAGQIE